MNDTGHRAGKPAHPSGFLRLAAFVLAACLSLFLLACSTQASGAAVSAVVPSFPPLPESEGLRIATASDLHFNPELRPGSAEPYEAAYNQELVDALLRDCRQQGAELLLLTGDLCNAGRTEHHRALIEKLSRAREDGLAIYVLPGNHDLAPITQTGFAELYADFGYQQAHSRDRASLSYCVLRGDLMILMMDTAGYSIGSIDLPGSHCPDFETAFLAESTLQWVEGLLQEAAERNYHVLAAGHYNLLPEVSRNPERTGYYLKNGDRFASLMRQYKVPLYLSGHQHIRSVYQEEGLTELLTEYLLAYPTGYGVLDLSDKQIVYTPRRIDVDAWAAESGSADPILLNFAQWQQDELYRSSVRTVDDMCVKNPLSSQEKALAAEFFYRTMDSFWQGSLHENREDLLAAPGYPYFLRSSEGYAYGWWLRELIETTSPLLAGFSLSW